ncbi:MAG: hypothetical protein AAF387_07375 [Pseudomonadota bacterium]
MNHLVTGAKNNTMERTHDIYQKAEIATDPQTRQQQSRDRARWQKDIVQFGRSKGLGDESEAVAHVAFLGYN